MIYLDSCALVKLVAVEAESGALQRFLSARAAQSSATSTLARVEVVRAVRHLGPEAVSAARRLLSTLDRVPLSEELLDAAADLDHGLLRSLDAIHLAAAVTLGPALTSFVTYDQRLAATAAKAGLPVAGPR